MKEQRESHFSSFTDELVARARIQDALLRYTRGFDRGDWELFRSAYHPLAQIAHGSFIGDVDEFVKFLASRRELMSHTAHMITNVNIDFQSGSRAVGEAYGIASQRFRPGAPEVAAGSSGARKLSFYRYVDRFQLGDDGLWYIVDGYLVLGDQMMEQITTPDESASGDAHGSDPHDDPLYRILASAGAQHLGADVN
jgi:hypothetical protein